MWRMLNIFIEWPNHVNLGISMISIYLISVESRTERTKRILALQTK